MYAMMGTMSLTERSIYVRMVPIHNIAYGISLYASIVHTCALWYNIREFMLLTMCDYEFWTKRTYSSLGFPAAVSLLQWCTSSPFPVYNNAYMYAAWRVLLLSFHCTACSSCTFAASIPAVRSTVPGVVSPAVYDESADTGYRICVWSYRWAAHSSC